MAAPLVHQVNIKATPDTIYKALSTAQGLQSFWTSESKAEPKVGAIATFGFGCSRLTFTRASTRRHFHIAARTLRRRFSAS